MLNNKELTSYDVIAGVKENNSDMVKVFERWQNDIALGIIGLANIFDPECVVLSGSMAEFVDVKKIEDIVNKEITTQPTTIRKATAGNYSGMIGVSLLALKGVA